MDVSHERHVASFRIEDAAHFGKRGGLFLPLRGEPHYFAPGFGDAQCLRRACPGVERVGVGHRL